MINTFPLISIIVPVYNVEKFIDCCINSIISQTYENFELILVDDGSPDNCPVICDTWGKKDTRIKVFHKSNGGLSDARNFGIKYAKGDYITFIDSDDFVSSFYLETLYNLIVNNNADISCAKHINFIDKSKVLEDNKTSENVLVVDYHTACKEILLLKKYQQWLGENYTQKKL